MYDRTIRAFVDRLRSLYPIIAITGPRQSGKTTLARSMFDTLPYVSLENLDTREWARKDPRAFLQAYHDGALFDEVQNVPELFSYLQEIVDSSEQKGRFVITGSQNFMLNNHITQSLSGRVGMTTLLPLSVQELKLSEADWSNRAYSLMFKGFYPALHKLGMHPLEFFPSYLQTYVERDVRQIKSIENLAKFQTFLKLCAGRVGQIFNLASLAQDAGISHTTARQWLTVLEASYILFQLQPFHRNFNKRLIKSPKLYFYDVGLVCSLLGIEKDEQLMIHYARGALFENFVIADLLKGRFNQGLPANMYFWRDKTGHEVDLVAEWGGHIHAFEIKSSMTFHQDFVKDLKRFCALAEDATGTVVYQGDMSGEVQGVRFCGVQDLC